MKHGTAFRDLNTNTIYMKQSVFCLFFILLFVHLTSAQNRTVRGTVTDSAKMALPATTVRLITDLKDTLTTTTSAKGYFRFNVVKASRITLTFSSIGYQGFIRHYALADTGILTVDTIILKSDSRMLSQVNIVGSNPVTFKEDTIEYKASAYKVRDNAPVEDLIRKLPGVDVDANGNITAQGKQVSKVRVNGKDFFNGDVQAATRNIPADIVENVQMIDDYGDQANLTGVKTGDPTKIMNITIKSDKSHGFTGQATLGDGSDVLPKQPGVQNDNRYLGLLNDFIFNGDQQMALLGNVNNTNVNTFSFGTPTPPPAGGGNLLEAKKIALDRQQILIGSGGSKINIGGGGNFTSQTSGVNGITDTHAAGFNFRDQWGKHLSVYGNYNFSDNTAFTSTNTLQQNNTFANPGSTSQLSKESDKNINHSIQWNMEYKPNDANYLKVTPTFSYAGSNGTQTAQNTSMRSDTINSAYNSLIKSGLNAPSYGFTALFNHRFKKKGRDLSIDLSANSTHNNYYQTPIYNFTAGPASLPDQEVTTKSLTNAYNANISYLEPVGQNSFLQFNYAFNLSKTTSDRQDNVLDTVSHIFRPDSTLSNHYNYTFITNRVGVNFNYVEKDKYNFTLGLALLPAVLEGAIPRSGPVRRETFNVVPTAHFVYNISRNKVFSLNYSGGSEQPTFTQLQPVTDYSNALYPVQGNPDLKPSFTNNLSIQYNFFDFGNNRTLFTNASFSQTQNQVANNTIIYPANYAPNPLLDNSYFTKYLNADGFYTAVGYISFNNPLDNRKYTLSLNGSVRFTNSISYITNVDPITYVETTEKNTARTLAFTPGMRFRFDLPELIDAQFLTNYSINKTFNSIQDDLTNATSNIRTWNLGLSGKNYFHDWTVSYDYSKAFNYGYAESVHATNPNLLNMYVECRFMKGHKATVRMAVFDVFNQNTGFSTTTTPSYITQTNVNRLGRYFLASFTLRLQKFAGK
ncbi:MAG: outer rane beta-barrel protein [Mucilaginibacter sp.]|nr:outer rane beta-barrel protein [Mucilaginibacter sp.]